MAACYVARQETGLSLASLTTQTTLLVPAKDTARSLDGLGGTGKTSLAAALATECTRGSLADACRESGRFKEAIALGKRALADRERVSGPGHPDTVSARASLAATYRDAKKPKDALSVYERIVADRERLQGPEHPDTILARCDLAATCLSARKLGQSIPQYERALTDSEQALGYHHPLTESVREDLNTAASAARSVLGIDLRSPRPASRSLLVQ